MAYETLSDDQGRLPLLTPMSEVAGRMSIQEGAKYLERPQMGRGILLGGVPGVEPAHITILGGGVVGANAAKIAAGFRANIGLLDIDIDRLRYLDDVMPANVTVLFSDRDTVREQLRPGGPGDRRSARARREGPAADRARRPQADEARQRDHRRGHRPGRLRGHQPADDARQPDLLVDDVLHYCVTNMPGAVGRTSAYALCNVTLPWALQIANRELEGRGQDALHRSPARSISARAR